MLSVLRDFLLSFSPADVRRKSRPESAQRTLRAATWGGLAQFFLATLLLVIRFKGYFARRAHELAPQTAGTTEVVQAGLAVIVTLEFILHPLSALLLYLAIEGFIRFIGGLITAEVVPSFAVFLGYKTVTLTRMLANQRRNVVTLPDTLEKLPDGRMRIASAQSKPGWNASLTIGFDGQWFEVERAESGFPPRVFVYLLRPAPAGKILRGYEEYNPAMATDPGAMQHTQTPHAGGAATKK